MDWGTLAAFAAIMFGAVGLQRVWLARKFDALKASLRELEASAGRLDAS